jgi:cell division protein FtsL
MQKEELYEEIERDGILQRYFGLSLSKFLFLFSVVVVLGMYISMLLYGTNSLEVLFELQDYEDYLQTQIKELKVRNAELQREYFELKEISAQ